jgi:hypothetical protein
MDKQSCNVSAPNFMKIRFSRDCFLDLPPYHASFALLKLWLKHQRKTNLGILKIKTETSSETLGKPYYSTRPLNSTDHNRSCNITIKCYATRKYGIFFKC